MTKLEELRAAYDADADAYAAARDAYGAAYAVSYEAADAAYQDELKKIQEENSDG